MSSAYFSKLNTAICRQQGVRSLLYRRTCESLSSFCSTPTSKPVLGDHHKRCSELGVTSALNIRLTGFPHRTWLRNFSTTTSSTSVFDLIPASSSSNFIWGVPRLSMDTDPFQESSTTVDP